MGGMLPGDPPQMARGQVGDFEILKFTPDKFKVGAVTEVPETLAGAPAPTFGEPQRTRRFTLDMHVGGRGPGMMMGRSGSGEAQGGVMGINGKSFGMGRVDTKMRRGETELWQINASEMAHPFHIHGTSFQVLTMNGKKVPYEAMGLKDIALIENQAELLVRVDHKASRDIPFMYHCHILEHEDAGMMGNFTVD